MKSIKTLLLTVFAAFAVMMLPATVNAAAVGPEQDLNNGPVTLDFFSVEDEDFEEGYIYPMTYTAPESGWYNVTAEGAMGLVLGYSEYYDTSYENDFDTYKNDTATFNDPVLAYKDDPYRSGAVCGIVYLDKGEEWAFSIIGKYFGSSFASAATFKVNLVRKMPKITGVSVNKNIVSPGDTVTYSIVFDQNLESWEITHVDVSEYIYGPNGEDIFTMSTYHRNSNYTVAGNTVTYSYPVTAEDYNRVLKMDYVYLMCSDYNDFTYANDTYRVWNGHNIYLDAGYIPGVPAVKYVTGNCYHNMLPGWLYTAVENGKEYELCELCDYKKLLGTAAPSGSGSSGNPVPSIPVWFNNVGSAIKNSTGSYTVKSYTEAEYKAPASAKASKVAIPDTITIAGHKLNVTSIAKNAFRGNKSLKTLVIGKNIERIGKNAFFNCKKLKKIKINTSQLTLKKIGKNAFKGTAKKASVKVPKKKLKLYKKILKKKGLSKIAKIK